MKKTNQEIKKIGREFEGQVVSLGNKTVHVLVKSIKMHPKYKKQYSTTKKFAVHDEKGIAKLGETIRFVETRPISKTKKWRFVEVLKAV